MDGKVSLNSIIESVRVTTSGKGSLSVEGSL